MTDISTPDDKPVRLLLRFRSEADMRAFVVAMAGDAVRARRIVGIEPVALIPSAQTYCLDTTQKEQS